MKINLHEENGVLQITVSDVRRGDPCNCLTHFWDRRIGATATQVVVSIEDSADARAALAGSLDAIRDNAKSRGIVLTVEFGDNSPGSQSNGADRA